MFELEKVPTHKQVRIEVEARTKEALLYAWLSELLFEAEVNGYFFSSFQIEQIWLKNERYYLKGVAIGSAAKAELLQTLVKGVTYHEFSLTKEQDKFVSTVVVDI